MATDYLLTCRAANPGTVTGYMQFQSGDVSTAFNSTESRVRNVMADTGTLKNLRVSLNTAPGAGNGRTFKVYKNGVATSLAVTISDTATSGADTSNTVSYVPGDTLSFEHTVAAGTPTASAVRYTAIWNGNGAQFMWGSAIAGPAASGTQYCPVQGEEAADATTETNVSCIMPTGGTITAIYVNLDTNLTGASGAWTITLRKNEANTALAATLNTGTAAANGSGSITVAQNDRLTITLVANANTTNSPRPRVTLLFTPTTAGESCTFIPASRTQAQNITRYDALGGGGDSWATTETTTQTLLQACTIKNLTTYTQGPIANNKTVTYTGRNNAADFSPSITCVATGDGTNPISASDVTNQPTAVNDDLLTIKCVTGAASGTVRPAVGLVLYIAPVSTDTSTEWMGYCPTNPNRPRPLVVAY